MDPTIMKFVPICHASKFIFNSDEWKFMDVRVGDCPNIVYYKRNEHFKAKQFLWEDCINWGNHKDHGGGRSVMLAAIRILFPECMKLIQPSEVVAAILRASGDGDGHPIANLQLKYETS
jgi:hypothetical protein